MSNASRRNHAAKFNSNRTPSSRFGQKRKQRSRTLVAERLEDRTLLALISYWTADNTAADAVGTNDGTLINGASYASGQINQAFPFRRDRRSRSSRGFTEPETHGVPDHRGVGPSRFATGSDRARSCFAATIGAGWTRIRSTVRPAESLRFRDLQSNRGHPSHAVMPLGQFVHVAGTLDDATGAMRLYLNGVLMAQTTTTVRPFGDLDPNSNPGIGIGNHGGYPNTPHNFPFHGLIDELKVYDHALTAEDVLANFNASKGSLQPAISISDVTIIEGDPSVRYLGNFISPSGGRVV